MRVNPVPETHNTATPYLIVTNANAAIDFYKLVFEATELIRLVNSDGKVAHAELKFGDIRIMLADEYPDMGYRSPLAIGGSAVSLLIYVPDVDLIYERALQVGCQGMMPVSEQFDGDRRGTVIDPFGHIWLLASRCENLTYEAMKQRFEQLISAAD